jgi:RNA polymerase sigma-70 factor (ECF subfamily)
MERSDPRGAGPDIIAEGAPGVADREDVARARAGDTRAFERIYRRHAARIHGLTRRMMGVEWADELTQDVFVRAWEKLGTFRGEAAFGTWLYRLAINVVLTRRAWLGTQRRRLDDQEETLNVIPARPAMTDLGMDFETAMERLPAGAREVFVLHDVEGYKHEEIAGMLGVTSGTTKAQLHRARMMLRKHLEA